MKYYYVYELIDPNTHTVFYVGKGSGDRTYSHTKTVKNGRHTENPHKDNKIKKLLLSGKEPIVNFVHVEIANEETAYDLEESLQLHYGIENLTNMCIGKRPPRNVFSDEEREKRRQRMIGNQLRVGLSFTDEWKEVRSKKYSGKGNPNYGKTPSDTTKYLNGSANRGKARSDEVKQKIRETSARTYQLTFPDKTVVIMKTTEFKKWLQENNHSEVWCYKCIRDNRIYKGISIKRID